MTRQRYIFNQRIIRSPLANFYCRDIEDAPQSHPDWYLKEISEQGFSGIWLHCILRDLVKSKHFPEFGKKQKEQISSLQAIVEKADKYNLKVYLYLCEPRSFRVEDSFWRKYPFLKGQPHTFKNAGSLNGTYYALCTSTDIMKDFLYQAPFYLFKKVGGLGGVFLITASEFHTHCYSHFSKHNFQTSDYNLINPQHKKKFECSRCTARNPEEVVCEIIRLINQGVKDANKQADVIAWTWSWNIIEPDPQEKLINMLPKDVILMSDWERCGYKFLENKKIHIDEYSFSYRGPSERFIKQFKLAKSRNMKFMAKIQIGTTHEMTAVPYIPVPYILAEKLNRMKQMGVDGYLGCWIFGGDISPMSKVAGLISTKPISSNKAIKTVAEKEFTDRYADCVMKAWNFFSRAWSYFPFSNSFLYYGPLNYAVICPFPLKGRKLKIIPSWMPLPRNKKGYLDSLPDINSWIKSPYTPEMVISCIKKILHQWRKGTKMLQIAAKKYGNYSRLQQEIDLANHIKNSFNSTVHMIEYLSVENCKNKAGTKMKSIMQKELKAVKEELEIIKRNRFGFHPEAHQYFINENDLKRKIRNLKIYIKKLEDKKI